MPNKKIGYTNNFDLFLLKPNIGIGPFILGKPISACCDGTFQLKINDQINILEKDVTDALAKHYSDIIPTRAYYVKKYTKKLVIFVNQYDKIISFSTEILYFNNKKLIGENIHKNKKILNVLKWDNIETINIDEAPQKIYYYDKFGLMFWTLNDIVLNADIYAVD